MPPPVSRMRPSTVPTANFAGPPATSAVISRALMSPFENANLPLSCDSRGTPGSLSCVFTNVNSPPMRLPSRLPERQVEVENEQPRAGTLGALA